MEAEVNYKKAYSLLLSRFGRRHPEIAMEANNLGSLYYKQERLSDAEREYNEALTLWELFLGPNHPDIARALNNLGTVYFHQKNIEKADAAFSRALEIWSRDRVLKNSPFRGVCLTNVAAVRAEQKRYAEAEMLFRQAVSLLEATTTKYSPSTLRAVEIFAKFYRTVGLEKKRAQLLREHKMSPDV